MAGDLLIEAQEKLRLARELAEFIRRNSTDSVIKRKAVELKNLL